MESQYWPWKCQYYDLFPELQKCFTFLNWTFWSVVTGVTWYHLWDISVSTFSPSPVRLLPKPRLTILLRIQRNLRKGRSSDTRFSFYRSAFVTFEACILCIFEWIFSHIKGWMRSVTAKIYAEKSTRNYKSIHALIIFLIRENV